MHSMHVVQDYLAPSSGQVMSQNQDESNLDSQVTVTLPRHCIIVV